MKRWLAVFLLAGAAAAQQKSGALSTAEAAKLIERTVQLMETAQPASPAVAGARQAETNLRVTPGNIGHTYAFLTNLKAYLTVADAAQKAYPAQAQPQLAELHAAADRLDAHFRALLDTRETQVRNPDRDNLRRYREANDRAGLPIAGKPRVVFLGDSITDGWRLNEYFPDRDFVNRGISGQVTGEMLGRMQADVIALKPAAMIVLAGTNDLARGTPLATIQNNLTSIADLAEFHKIKVLFASILPVSDYHKNVNPRFEVTRLRPPAQIVEMNRWLRQLCQKRGFTYVDYFAALADPQGFLGSGLADDGLHPNPTGYRLMAPVALSAIDSVLKAGAAAAPARKR